MCGRFTARYTWAEIKAMYELLAERPSTNTPPRYNICPTTTIDAIGQSESDRSLVPISTLVEGSFLGLTALTRQPNLASAYALEEVTALEIDREHIEHLVTRAPLLLQNFGNIIEERRSKVRSARRGERVG